MCKHVPGLIHVRGGSTHARACPGPGGAVTPWQGHGRAQRSVLAQDRRVHVAHACASMDRCLGGPTPGGPPHPTWGHITSRPHPGVCTVPGAKVWSDHSPPGRETEARGGWAGPSPPPHPRPGLGGRPWLTRVSRSDLCPGGGGSRVSLPTPPEDPGARVVAVPPQLRPLPAAQACAAPPPPPHHGQPPRGRHGGRHGVSPPPTPAPPSAAGRGGGEHPGRGSRGPTTAKGRARRRAGGPGEGGRVWGRRRDRWEGGAAPPPASTFLPLLL